MLGGDDQKDIINFNEKEILENIKNEMKSIFNIKSFDFQKHYGSPPRAMFAYSFVQVWKEEELKSNWENAKNEAKASFGDDGMYLEKFIEKPRHIEIQIISDQKGRAAHLSERDCSIQRRHQKLLEETPSPFMTKKLRDEMGKAAIKAAEAVKYEWLDKGAN